MSWYYGSGATIIISLTSKMVENDHLIMDISVLENVLINKKVNKLLFLHYDIVFYLNVYKLYIDAKL